MQCRGLWFDNEREEGNTGKHTAVRINSHQIYVVPWPNGLYIIPDPRNGHNGRSTDVKEEKCRKRFLIQLSRDLAFRNRSRVLFVCTNIYWEKDDRLCQCYKYYTKTPANKKLQRGVNKKCAHRPLDWLLQVSSKCTGYKTKGACEP